MKDSERYKMDEVNIKKIIEALNIKYYELYPNMLKVPAEIVFTDCLSKSSLELRPDLTEQLIAEEIEQEDCNNGRMVLPHVVGDTICILLNIQKIIEYTEDKTMTWIGTFGHELTHTIDYYQMAVKEGLTVYDPLQEISQYHMFQLWSEYHARKLGYNFLRKQLNVDNEYNEMDRIEHILNIEWPFQMNLNFQSYHKTNDGNKQMYYTMQLLGRYSVWCDLFPEYFNEAFTQITFSNNPWMYNIFNFLREHESLDLVYSKFEDMRLILKENWKTL